MSIIQSHIDTNSDNFKLNYKYNKQLYLELDTILKKIHEMGSPNSISKHKNRGK